MSETNPPAQPSVDATPPSPAPRKRRWVKGLIITFASLLVVVILLIVLLPTLLSTGPGRRIVLNQADAFVNGDVSAEDWHLSWTGGIEVTGLSIRDLQGNAVLSIARLHTPLSLLSAIRGNYDLGQVLIDRPVIHLVVDDQGHTNLAKLFKESADQEPPRPSAEQKPLPNVRGTLKIQDLTGTVTGAGVPQPLTVREGNLTVEIPDLNSTLSDQIHLVLAVGDQPPGTLSLTGSMKLFTNGQFVADHLAVQQTLKIEQLPAPALTPFLKMSNVDLQPDGTLHAALDASLAGTEDLAATGSIEVERFALTGAALQGDTLRSSHLKIPIDLSRATRQGQPQLNGRVLVALDQGSIGVEVHAPQIALPHAADLLTQALRSALGEPPSGPSAAAPGAGQVVVHADLDIATLLNQLPHLLGLTEGTHLEKGRLTHKTSVDLNPDRATIHSHTAIDNVRGQVDGKAGALQPISLDLGLVALGGPNPGISDLSLQLASAFAALDGGGASLQQLNLKGSVDLAKAQSELGQFFDLDRPILDVLAKVDPKAGVLGVTSADLEGQVRFTLQGDGDVAHADAPLRLRGTVDTSEISVGGAGLDLLRLPLLEIAFDLPVQRVAQGEIAAIRDAVLSLKAGPGPGQVMELLARGDFNPADGSVPAFELQNARINLALAQRVLAPMLPALQASDLQFEGGQLTATATGSWSSQTLALQQLDIRPVQVHLARHVDGQRQVLLDGLTARLAAAGTIQTAPQTAIQLQALELTESNGALNVRKINDGPLSILLPPQGPAQLDGAIALSGELAKVQALLDAFTTTPASLRWTDGTVSAQLAIRTDGPTTQVGLQQLQGQKIAFSNGPARYTAKPIDLKAQLQFTSNEQGIDQLTVNQLQGNLGVATLGMTEPIKLRGLTGGHLSAEGSIELAGEIQPVMELIDAINGNASNQAPYSGAFALTQKLSTQGDNLSASGHAQLSDLAVRHDGKQVFEEKSLQIVNDLAVDIRAHNLRVNRLDVVSQTSQALNLSAKGSILDYQAQRRLEGLEIELVYDLLKLFELVRPMLSDSLQQDLADAKMWGQYQRRFVVQGALPADQPFNQAVRQLRATGGIAIGGFQGMGYSLANLDVPVRLADGRLTIGGGDQPPAPATLNDGELNLNGAVVDMTGEHLRLTLPPNHPLLASVALNPVLASTAMGSFNPMFVSPDRAGGFVDVTAVKVVDVPLDGLLTQRGANAGEAELIVSVRELAIENPFTQAMSMFMDKKATGGAMFRGGINNAKIDIAGGILSQDLTLNIGGFNLNFSGKVSLADQRLMPLNITIPAAQLASVDKNLVKYLPAGITIPITGTTSNFHIAIDQVLPKLVADAAARALLDRGLGGNRDKKQPDQDRPQQPQQQQPDNPLLDLFKQLQRDQQR